MNNDEIIEAVESGDPERIAAVKETVGFDELEDLYEKYDEQWDEYSEIKQEVRDILCTALNAMFDRSRLSVNEEITIREGDVYQYNQRYKAKIETVIKIQEDIAGHLREKHRGKFLEATELATLSSFGDEERNISPVVTFEDTVTLKGFSGPSLFAPIQFDTASSLGRYIHLGTLYPDENEAFTDSDEALCMLLVHIEDLKDLFRVQTQNAQTVIRENRQARDQLRDLLKKERMMAGMEDAT